MHSKATIQSALTFADSFAASLSDMNDHPLQRPGSWGGNHAMWIAGHLAVAEGRLHKMLFDEPNPLEHWKPMFDWGTTPVDDASKYPPFEEVLGTLAKLRARTYAYLDTLEDKDLSKPTPLPAPGMPFDTVGQTLLLIALHQCLHAGEATVARRATGRQPFFVPSDELRAF